MKRALTIDLDFLLKECSKRWDDIEKDTIPNLTQAQFWQVIKWSTGLTSKDLEADYDMLVELCESLEKIDFKSRNTLIKVFTDHHEVYPILNREEELEIVNIDLHHDILYRDEIQEEVDCGNWIYHLARQGKIEKYTWIRRQWSNREVPRNFRVRRHMEFESRENVGELGSFDYIFIIKSPYYTPLAIQTLSVTLEKLLYIVQQKEEL